MYWARILTVIPLRFGALWLYIPGTLVDDMVGVPGRDILPF